IYPNPTNDGKVNIVFEETNLVRDISVLDMSGRTIKIMKGITNNNVVIDNLTPGMYSIRIVAVETGEQVVEKIVVNKR
ncbi:MAG: T9SS type A sorting domain-containing protein, partial [Chitinophagaceae bacterium]